MSKRTGQKKRAPRARTARASGPVFFEHPLSAIPREQALSGLAELGRTSQTQLATGLQEVVNILRSIEPLQTIATLAACGLTASVKSSGEMSPLYKDPRFGQAHVELAQAIALSLAIEGQPVRPPRPTEIQRLFDVLPDIGSAFGLQRLGRAQEDLSSEEKSVALLQQRLRMHTQSVRNWGFFDRVLRIVTALH